jgi:hypothetical protein
VPEPTPTPPDPCPSPKPVLHRLKVEKVGTWADVTPLVRSHPYCVEIGLPTLPDGVTPRYECPVRPEGHPDRAACEREAVGVLIWECTLGGTVVVNTANRFQAKCSGAYYIRACDASGTICAGVNL